MIIHALQPIGLSKEDLERRRHTLGSSEIAPVLGMSPYASPHDVWNSKVLGQDFEGNEATELGTAMEGPILSYYAYRYGKTLTKGTYTLGPEPWISATPDALIDGEDGLVEAKLVGFRTLYQWGNGNTDEETSDAVPLHYLCQAMWQLLVTRRAFCDICALMGTEFRTYRIYRDETVITNMVGGGRAFWFDHVRTAQPPPIDGSDGCRTVLRKLYPRSGGEPIKATPEIDAIAANLQAAREQLDAAKAEASLYENQMRAALRDAPGARGDGWRVRYSSQKDGKRPLVFDGSKK